MIDRTEVDLRALIGEVITDTAPESARRGFTVHWTCDRPLTVEGNEGLLYSVFRNLTDNALNYSGGNRIDIALTDETDDRYEFSFSDNGTGVNPEHLPYLFERFYRIDKGRSRRAEAPDSAWRSYATPYFSTAAESKWRTARKGTRVPVLDRQEGEAKR